MTLLQIFFIVSGVVLLILGFDIYRKKKFTFLHIFLFFLMAIALIVFTFFPSFLDKLGKFVGVQRGADALVYVSIIFLIYFVLFLFNKIEKNKSDITNLVRQISFLEYELKNNDKK